MRRSSGGLMALALVAPVALIGCSGRNDSKDVAITSCKSDPTAGYPTMDGTITNKSNYTAIYAFTVEWDHQTDPDTPNATVSTADVSQTVGAGQTAQWHATSTLNPIPALTCRISPNKAKGLHLGHVGGPNVKKTRA